MPRTPLSATVACALALLASAGCGGDDEPEQRSPATDTGAQAARTDGRADTAESQTRTSERGGKAGGSKKERSEKTARAGKKKRNPAGKDEPDARGGKSRSSNPSKDEPAARRGGNKARSGGPAANRAVRPLTGRALRRCVTRAARQRSRERRIRAQARCVGLTAGELRRQIRRVCRVSSRKARNPRAAERRCLRAGLG